MNFNYRDFFIHNDDLHIIKEQLSIIDEMPRVSKEYALAPNAKAVWDMFKKGSNEETIAAKLKINVETVKKIITICLMKATDDKITSQQIATELDIKQPTVFSVLTKTLASDFEREKDTHFVNDAGKIYDYHQIGKTPEEIVNLVNNEKKEYIEKINLNKVNAVLKIVDMAKKQMADVGEVNAQKIKQEIEQEIVYNISYDTIKNIIKKLNLGKPRYLHKFTEEQDAFILYCYLKRNGVTEISRKFNKKFSTESNQLDIVNSSVLRHIEVILKPKGESDISDYIVKLLTMYKDTYFQAVDIQDSYTKNLLTKYIPPETVRGRDTTGTGTNRDMSAHIGTLPKNFSTMVTNLRNAHTIR